jgi:hypothetical protein
VMIGFDGATTDSQILSRLTSSNTARSIQY